MKKVYLATPFTHKIFLVRWWRFLVVTRCAARLMRDGYVVFSPITHSFPIALFMPNFLMCDGEFWERQDIPWLLNCDCLIILKLKGYKKSKGVLGEWGEAAERFMPIKKFTPKQILQGEYKC